MPLRDILPEKSYVPTEHLEVHLTLYIDMRTFPELSVTLCSLVFQCPSVAFSPGLQVEPENHIIWSNMATIYAYGQAPEQALQALKEAMRLNATHPAVAHNAQALASGVQEGVLLFHSVLDLGRKA